MKTKEELYVVLEQQFNLLVANLKSDAEHKRDTAEIMTQIMWTSFLIQELQIPKEEKEGIHPKLREVAVKAKELGRELMSTAYEAMTLHNGLFKHYTSVGKVHQIIDEKVKSLDDCINHDAASELAMSLRALQQAVKKLPLKQKQQQEQ